MEGDQVKKQLEFRAGMTILYYPRCMTQNLPNHLSLSSQLSLIILRKWRIIIEIGQKIVNITLCLTQLFVSLQTYLQLQDMGGKFSIKKQQKQQNLYPVIFKPKDKVFHLNKMALADDDLKYMSRSDLSKVSQVNLGRNLITGLSEEFTLFSHSNFTQLLVMNLSFNQLQDGALQQLCKANCDQLQILLLNNNSLTSWGVLHLRHVKWKKLKELNLSQNCIGDYGLSQLAKGPFKQLKNLSMFRNCLTNKCSKFLKNCSFIHLQKLNLAQNMLTCEGITNIFLIKFASIKQLRLRGFAITVKQKQYITRISNKVLGKDIFFDF